jgi:hypothetical protein
VFVSPGGTEHDFAWQGDLVYFGTHLGGTWVYESDWEDLGTDTRGHVWSRGELRSTTTGDTGY